MKNFTQKFIGLLALVFAMTFTVSAQDEVEVVGCMDSTASNYDSQANIEIGEIEDLQGTL